MLAEMGQLTIRDYLRRNNLYVTNNYLQATSKTKRHAQDRLVDAILPGLLAETEPGAIGGRFAASSLQGTRVWRLSSPNMPCSSQR